MVRLPVIGAFIEQGDDVGQLDYWKGILNDRMRCRMLFGTNAAVKSCNGTSSRGRTKEVFARALRLAIRRLDSLLGEEVAGRQLPSVLPISWQQANWLYLAAQSMYKNERLARTRVLPRDPSSLNSRSKDKS